jgi:hypothetical protein
MKCLNVLPMFLGLAVAAAYPLAADESKSGKSQENAQEKDEIRDSISKNGKPDACLGARQVNFRADLKVPFDYLDTLGTRIHQARKASDPVELAACARSLAAAEEASGKQASLTSAHVMADAVNLAKMRGIPSELKAVAALTTDADTAAELKEGAQIAEEGKKEPGQKDRQIFGTLQVINHSGECLTIQVDGIYVGTVHSGDTANLPVHSHNWQNHLDAYCLEGGELIRHGDYAGHTHFLQWHIDP